MNVQLYYWEVLKLLNFVCIFELVMKTILNLKIKHVTHMFLSIVPSKYLYFGYCSANYVVLV